MYDIEKDEVVPDYFLAQNGRGLGDTAQDMIVYGDKMYIAVYGESTIEVTDLKAKSIKQVKQRGSPVIWYQRVEKSILAIIMDMSLVWIPHPWRLRRR